MFSILLSIAREGLIYNNNKKEYEELDVHRDFFTSE